MLWILFKISVNVFHAALLLFFMHSRLRFKNFHKLGDILFIAILSAVLSLPLFLPYDYPIELGFLLFIPYSFFVVKDKLHITAFWLIVFATLFFSTVDISQYVLLSIPNLSSMDILIGKGVPNAVFNMVYCAFLFLVIYLASRFKRDFTRMSWSNLFLFLSLIVCIYIVEKFLFHIQLGNPEYFDGIAAIWFLFSYIGLSLCTFFTIVLFQNMSALADKEAAHQAELEAATMGKQHHQELERLYNQLSAKQHDFKQHLQTLVEMVKTGGNENAKAYLETYQMEAAQEIGFATGSPAADALLTAKYLTMIKSNIVFDYSLCPLYQLPVSSTQFCTLLGNLLDNAIEAIKRINAPQSPVIHLRILRHGEMLYLLCSNPCNPDTIRHSEDRWYSSKPDPHMHSIGIRNIRRIVEGAEGRCEFVLKENIFHAKLVIPYSFSCENT